MQSERWTLSPALWVASTKMKLCLRFLLVLVAIFPFQAWAQSTDPADFIASLRTAIQEKSADKLNALIYTVGMSASDRQMAFLPLLYFNNAEIDTISLVPLPPNFQSIYIVNGKKLEPTYPPIGQVQIEYKKVANGPLSLSPAYAIVDGHYFIISAKSTDLGWKGPQDKTLGFSLMGGSSKDKVQIKVKWNASGVDQERVYQETSALFLGQYIEGVTVTSDNPETTLIITEGGKEVFHSSPLKDKKSIEYRKS
jgi:hypothetical protein